MNEPGAAEVVLVVEPAARGERLDRWLARVRPDWTRSTLQRWIVEARVTVDARPGEAARKLRGGEVIAVRPAPPPPSEALAEALPLEVLFEDDHLLVIDKAAGVVVHPAPGHASGTLVNALLFHDKVRGGAGTSRPGIVHRLDKGTSGVMVVAKSERAREGLVATFKAHAIERRYVAIVAGNPPEAVTLSTRIGRHPVDRKRFTTRVPRGRTAITHVVTLERFEGAALVACSLETGRTHQIRVHASESGFPIAGDPTYGGPRSLSGPTGPIPVDRPMLHAEVLGFVHPVTGAACRFEADVPRDFAQALTLLRASARRPSRAP